MRRKLRIYGMALLATTLLAACSKVPDGILSEKKMQGVLTDMLLADLVDRFISVLDEPLFLLDRDPYQPGIERAWGRYGDWCLWYREPYRFSFRNDYHGI